MKTIILIIGVISIFFGTLFIFLGNHLSNDLEESNEPNFWGRGTVNCFSTIGIIIFILGVALLIKYFLGSYKEEKDLRREEY